MKNVLYVGNKLVNKKSNVSAIHSLGALLEQEGYNLYYSSSKTNILLRLIDMLVHCYTYRNKVDVVLIDTYSTLNFYYAFLVSRWCSLLKLKYIPILHGGNLPKRLIKSPKKAKAIFNNAYVNVAPSLYIKEKFEALGYTNISHIPNSIEIQKYKFKQRDFKSINLLWVRSFSKIYNPILAIQVLKSLKDKGIEASLCMVGPDSDGSLQEAKKVATQNNLAVTFTGKLSKDKWIELSKAYSFFINTTNFDNMPVSVIEAMALGMPVISTNVGGIPYLIADKKTGILVSPNQEEEFVNAIKYLIATPEKALAIAENAREFAQQLDWLHIKQKWNALLLHIEE